MPSVGKTIPHDSAVGHVTGRAAYIDDMPPLSGELVVGFVGSPVACGVLNGVDASAARTVPGVVAVLTAADVPGHNHFGLLAQDEAFLAERDLVYLGQPVAVIAAECREALACAIAAVKLDVAEQPPLLDLEESIAQERFFPARRHVSAGDCDAELEAALTDSAARSTAAGRSTFISSLMPRWPSLGKAGRSPSTRRRSTRPKFS
jgi:xanthine dehydrogenase large subunit